MKSIRSLIFLTALTICANVFAAGDPYVAPYFNDKKGAYSITFDDGFKREVADALEIIDPLGVKATFFVIPSRMDNAQSGSIGWADAKAMQANGHEIGTHDAIKPKLHEIPQDEVRAKVSGGADAIEQNVGVRSVSFAMPGGSKDTPEVMEVVNEKHYFYRNPEYLPKAKRVAYGNAGNRQWDDQKTRKEIEQVMANGEWYIPVCHSIVKGYSPFKSKEEFKTHMEWVAAQDDLWVAPMGTVGRYAFERDAAQLEVIAQTADSVVFRLSHTLEDKAVFNHPLTVVIPGTGATAATAINEAREPVEATIKDGKILVNALPNGEAYKVTW